MSYIPYGHQDISDADIAAVNDVLRSDWLTQGPVLPRFERAVADQCGAAHAVAVNSATSALHIACMALGLSKGDWLWTSPITFVASANCALYCGAQVDFVDIDPMSYNMSVTALARKLQAAKAENKLPKIVVAVHFGGQSCDMEKICALGAEYGFHVLEDASHAIGGRYQERRIGDCRYSEITVFSFHPVKIITTAEGGMALTNDAALARRMELARSHGVTRDPKEMVDQPHGPWYYEQTTLGFNYRMTEIQAALGISQMQRLETYVSRRHEIARRYDELTAKLPLSRQSVIRSCYSAFHLYVIRLRLAELRTGRRQVLEYMRSRDIGVNVHYIPVHLQPFYRRMGFRPGDFPESERYYAEALTLPMFPALTDAQQVHVVNCLEEALGLS